MASTATSWIAKRREVKAKAAEVMKANAEEAKAALKAYREAQRTGQPVAAPVPEEAAETQTEDTDQSGSEEERTDSQSE